MIKEDLVLWAEENLPEHFQKYICTDSEEEQKSILKIIAETRINKEPEFVIGFHPEVLKKLNVKFKSESISEEIKRLAKKLRGTYLYTINF